MATVTVYTADRMKEIEDSAIIDGDVVDDNLILTRYDAAQINAGSVRGAQGIQGDIGPAGATSIEVVTSTTRPANPFAGLMIYETDTNNFLSYNGTTWVLPKNVSGTNRHFQARRTTTFSVPNNVFTAIPMPTTDENTVGSGSWNGTSYTIGMSGLYIVSYSLLWASNTVGTRLGYINAGTDRLGAQEFESYSFSGMSGQVVRRFASGTVLTVMCLQTSGGSLNVNPDNGRVYFTITPQF